MKKKAILVLILTAMACLFPATVYAEDVTVTVPAGSDMSIYPGGEDGVTNEDGTITFTLDNDQQTEWKEIIDKSMHESVKELLDDDATYPSLVDFQYNDSMTEFTITYAGEPSMQESMVYTLYPYWAAPLYQQVCGIPENEVDYKLTSINQDTQEEYTSNYSDAIEFAKSLGMGSISEGMQKTKEKESAIHQSDFLYEQNGYTYKYLKSEVVNDSSWGKSVYVYFEFTNKSGQTCQPASALTITAFQNGVELDYVMPGYENIPEESNNAYKQVQDGTTLNIALLYVLSDDSDVSLEIKPAFYNQDTEIGKYTFELNN